MVSSNQQSERDRANIAIESGELKNLIYNWDGKTSRREISLYLKFHLIKIVLH